MQTTKKKKTNDLHNLFAAFAALAATLFAPTSAAARPDASPQTWVHVLRHHDNGQWVQTTRFKSNTRNPSRAAIQDALFEAHFGELNRFCEKMSRANGSGAYVPTRAASDAFRAHFDPKAQPVKSPPALDARSREDETFRAYFAEGTRPVASPAHLDRRPRPLTL